MEYTSKLPDLFGEIKDKVQYLENALDEINQVKKSLKVTCSDVKAQVRDSISRHLEALRNREIWLLSQAELIQHGKEDVLSYKQAELLQLMGGMKKVCHLLEQSSETEKLGELEVFEDHLSVLIKSVENMSVAPEESPNILFSSHNVELLESIRAFGRVDCDCFKEESQIASIMKKMDLSDMPNNKRKFIASNEPIENWLLHGQRYQHEPTSLSIEKWFTKCKPYSGSDVQSEMGYSEKSDGNDNQWIISQEKSQKQQDDGNLLAYFNEVKVSSPLRWIRQSTKTPHTTPRTGKTYSNIVSLGNENWLLYKQERIQLRSVPADLGNIHNLEDWNTKWLKKSIQVDNLPHTSTGKAYATLAASKMRRWLTPKKQASGQLTCNGKTDCSNCDNWLLTSTSSSAVIKNDEVDYPDSLSEASWTNVKHVDVVSIENLESIFSRCNKANTLSDLPVNQDDKSGIKKYNAILQAQPIEGWLQSSVSSEKDMESQPSNTMTVFPESLNSNDYNKWLLKPSGLPSDVCKWLTRSSQERCKNCPKTCSKGLFTWFDGVKGTSSKTWLVNSAQN